MSGQLIGGLRSNHFARLPLASTRPPAAALHLTSPALLNSGKCL
eukprot:CAMPEP_0184384534 /NCGR_PEP_ID=MMETSP0007-20130409/7955_1 /TAXON_ID=97485 /ORGANISM="Prymnesium parvum, Strain Texoma1" /LENGTH=43 /DNA_ID= /DNA_START= /DNA_END= /DNA_ORIENTATION=